MPECSTRHQDDIAVGGRRHCESRLAVHLGVEVITPRLTSFVRLVPCAVRHLVAGSAAPALAGSAARAGSLPGWLKRARASHRACRSTNVGPSPQNGRHAAEADRHQGRYERLAHVVSNDAGRFPVLCSVRVPRSAALPSAPRKKGGTSTRQAEPNARLSYLTVRITGRMMAI